jgi:hypothetical protein
MSKRNNQLLKVLLQYEVVLLSFIDKFMHIDRDAPYSVAAAVQAPVRHDQRLARCLATEDVIRAIVAVRFRIYSLLRQRGLPSRE